MVYPWGQKYTYHTADTIRHTAIIDVNHGWAGLVTGTTTNWYSETDTSYAGQEAAQALPLFGRSGTYAKDFRGDTLETGVILAGKQSISER